MDAKHNIQLVFFFAVFAFGVWGCAGYAGEVAGMRTALSLGDKEGALKQINGSMELEKSDHYPKDADGETSLLLLERGSVKQSMTKFESSALDFRVANQNLELLDVKNKAVGEISKWIFSGDAGVYRAPSHELLLLHTLNMLNYLAMGQLESARVEARRFDLVQQYLLQGDDSNIENLHVLGLGDYLAGFTFEMSKRYEQAMQYYGDALANNEYHSLDTVLKELSYCTSYRNEVIDKHLVALGENTAQATQPSVQTTISQEGQPGEEPPTARVGGCAHPDRRTGTILVVSSVGIAPYKVATRLPIGLALVLAGAYLSPAQNSEANAFAVKGLLKWVNFAELKQRAPFYESVNVKVDGRDITSEYGDNISQVVKNSFEATKGKLIAAAIVRMIARAVAGAATNHAVSSGSGKNGLGLLAQVLVEGAMTVADTPDTRSWNALPASIFLSRIEVPAGVHAVSVHFQGASGKATVTKEVSVYPGGFAVVPVHQLR